VSDLEFSVMAHGPTTADDLRPILAKFEAEHRVKIKLRVFTWETGWTETMKFALYGHGPDVSEIGSTWVGTLAATGTVRPFGIREIAAVGGRFAFLHPSWQSGYLSGQPEMWAMPWLGNVRFVFYRHDLFQQAGIDAATAFRTSAQFMQTLTRLQDAGVSVPLVIPTNNSLNTLHTVAPLVWGAGGNFVEQTGKHTIFNTAEARSGFRAYYDLHRYLAPAAQRLDTEQSDQFFLKGGAAVTISDPGLLNTLVKNPPADPITIRTALPPGIPFVGGSNLIVWRHSPNHKLAVELVRFLISQQNQITYSQRARSLPVRLDALTGRPFATDPLFQPAVEGLKLGRSYPTSRLWGLMEEKLVTELNEVWDELFTTPDLDLDRTLDDHFRPLGTRLDAILAADTRK